VNRQRNRGVVYLSIIFYCTLNFDFWPNPALFLPEAPPPEHLPLVRDKSVPSLLVLLIHVSALVLLSIVLTIITVFVLSILPHQTPCCRTGQTVPVHCPPHLLQMHLLAAREWHVQKLNANCRNLC